MSSTDELASKLKRTEIQHVGSSIPGREIVQVLTDPSRRRVGQRRAAATHGGDGRAVLTAIWKHQVAGRVPLRGVNLEGDDQADRTVHGGPDKAAYAYAREDIEWWEKELGRALGEAPVGENLTVSGLPVSEGVIGEKWALGSVLLQVAQPRLPCFKLGLRMGDPRFLKRFVAARRPGTYLRILHEGDIAAGDQIAVTCRPTHGVTSALVFRALLGDRSSLEPALAADQLPEDLRAWMQQRATRARLKVGSTGFK
jgi:MOSC domain-containing protein YiiM